MDRIANITPRIVENLFTDAQVLADELAAGFREHICNSGATANAQTCKDVAAEGLRVTNLLMEGTNWLANHRAYFRGELSDHHYRTCKPLSNDVFHCTQDGWRMMPLELRELVEAVEQFHLRLLRLEHGRQFGSGRTAPVLRQRC